MSEPVGMAAADEVTADGAGMAGGASAGAMLRQLRESAGVSIEALAGTLKVPLARLQSLEADQHDAFTDLVFMRALASSVCRALRADAAPVLALLPQGQPVPLAVGNGINARFKDSSQRPGRPGALDAPKSRVLGVAVAVLLAGALAIAFLPKGDGGADEGVALNAPLPSQPAQEPAQQAGNAAAPADQAMAVTQEPALTQAPSQPAVARPTAAADGVAPIKDTSAAEAANLEGVLVIRARTESWVQVRNAAGGVVVQKILLAGESFSAAGDPPWSVVIGKADATDVIVRGQPLDLKAIARDNVARFEVK